MNNLKSYTEYAVSTPTTDFVIGFDFNYGTDAVNVTVDDVPATEAGYSVIYLNSTTMRLGPAVPTGVVRLQRETDIDVPDNQFTAGAKFIASNMDENFTQLRHAQQEVRDGFAKLSEDTYEIIDTLQDVGQAAQDAADAAEQAAQTANDAAAQVNDKVSYADLDTAVSTGIQDTVAEGIPTTAIKDASGKTQQEINSDSTFVVNPLTDDNFKAELQHAVSNYKSVLIRGTHEIDLSDAVAVVPSEGCSIYFDPNAKITVKPNNLERYYLFDLDGVSDVNFWSPHCVGDKDTHAGTTGQWGHCFNLMNCENINIYYPKSSKFWGDGIYINGAKNTKVFNPELSGNRRQGMSIIKCQELDVYFADISNTSGQDPAYGVDIEINWAGEHCTGIRFHNPTFKNNGEGGSYRAGFCMSTHRAQYVEGGGSIPVTNFEVELYNPKFYGDALIVSAYIDQVHGYFKCYNPEFYNSNLSALLFNNHQSRNFFSEIYNPKFYDCVQNQTTIYENVMQFNVGSGAVAQTNGTCNIKIINPEFYASDAAIYKTIAMRNLTRTTYTDDLKNVEITGAKFFGYATPFTLANGATANTPDSTFKLSYANDSSYANLDHASNISEILDRTRLEYKGSVAQAVCYLNDAIPISKTEFSIKNNATANTSNLTINFGTSSVKGAKIVLGLSNGVAVDGIVLEKGAEVTLIKKSENIFEVVRTVGRVLTTTQKGASITYDPPEIAAGSMVTTTVALQGVVVGNPVVASFNRYNPNLELSAIVNAENTVTVKFKNTGTSPIDLLSGTLTVKAI